MMTAWLLTHGWAWQEAESRRLDHAEEADVAAGQAACKADSGAERTAEELKQNIAVPMAYNYV